MWGSAWGGTGHERGSLPLLAAPRPHPGPGSSSPPLHTLQEGLAPFPLSLLSFNNSGFG